MQTVDLYTRVSTDQQEDNTSLEEQEDAGRRYCLENGLEVGMVHREIYSGYAYREREKLTLMRQRYRDGLIQGIVIRTIDRLSRNQTHLAVLMEECEHHHVTIHCVKEKIDSTPLGKFLLAALGLIAEMEREKFIDRGLTGKVAAAKAGKYFTGKWPRYGWKWHDDRLKDYLVINEEQAEVLRWAAREYASGATILGLIAQLKERGIASPTGETMWTRNALRRLLTDVRNTGTGAQMFVSPSKKAKRNLDPVDLPDGTYPAIFDVETFNQIIVRTQTNREEAARNGSDPENFLLRAGFVFCANCGYRMTGIRFKDWRNKEGNWQYIYMCPHKPKCPGYSVRSHKLDNEVWNELVQLAEHISLIEEAVRLASKRDNADANIKGVERTIAEWQDQVKQYTNDLKKHDLRGATRASVLKLLDDANAMVEQLEEEKRKLLVGEYNRRKEQEAYGELLEWCRKVKDAREPLTYQKKRDFLRLVGAEVRVHHVKRGKSGIVSYDIKLRLPALQAVLGGKSAGIAKQSLR